MCMHVSISSFRAGSEGLDDGGKRYWGIGKVNRYRKPPEGQHLLFRYHRLWRRPRPYSSILSYCLPRTSCDGVIAGLHSHSSSSSCVELTLHKILLFYVRRFLMPMNSAAPPRAFHVQINSSLCMYRSHPVLFTPVEVWYVTRSHCNIF